MNSSFFLSIFNGISCLDTFTGVNSEFFCMVYTGYYFELPVHCTLLDMWIKVKAHHNNNKGKLLPIPQETISCAKLPPHPELCCILCLPSLKWFYGIQNHDNHYCLKGTSKVVFVWKEGINTFIWNFLIFLPLLQELGCWHVVSPSFFLFKDHLSKWAVHLGTGKYLSSRGLQMCFMTLCGNEAYRHDIYHEIHGKGFSWDMWGWDFCGYDRISVDMMTCWGGDRLSGRCQTALFSAVA